MPNFLPPDWQREFGIFLRTNIYAMLMDEHGRYILIGGAILFLLVMYILMGKAESAEQHNKYGGQTRTTSRRRNDPDYW